MHPPAVAVQRLLYGTGVGLLLGVGFGLQAGRSLGSSTYAIELLSATSVLFFVLGWMLGNGVGPLAVLFSHESEEVMAQRVREEDRRGASFGGRDLKWAELEAKVLTHDLGEQE